MALRNRGRKSDPHAAAAAVDAGPVAAEPVTAPAVFLGGLASEVDERAVAAPFEQIAAIAERVLRAYRDRHLSAEGTAARLAALRVTTGDGRQWTVGATSLRWYRRRAGGSWRLDTPPTVPDEALVESTELALQALSAVVAAERPGRGPVRGGGTLNPSSGTVPGAAAEPTEVEERGAALLVPGAQVPGALVPGAQVPGARSVEDTVTGETQPVPDGPGADDGVPTGDLGTAPDSGAEGTEAAGGEVRREPTRSPAGLVPAGEASIPEDTTAEVATSLLPDAITGGQRSVEESSSPDADPLPVSLPASTVPAVTDTAVTGPALTVPATAPTEESVPAGAVPHGPSPDPISDPLEQSASAPGEPNSPLDGPDSPVVVGTATTGSANSGRVQPPKPAAVAAPLPIAAAGRIEHTTSLIFDADAEGTTDGAAAPSVLRKTADEVRADLAVEEQLSLRAMLASLSAETGVTVTGYGDDE